MRVSPCRAVFAATLVLFAAAEVRAASKKRSPTASPTPTAITALDARGEELKLKRAPSRIVSLAPSVTECLFALGAGKKVAAVTKYCDWPEEAKKLPKIGDFSRPSVEKIVATRPSLVVAAKGNDLGVLAKLKKLKVPVYATDFQTLDDVVAGMETLGKILGDPEAGVRARNEMLESLGEIMKHVPPTPDRRLRVYWGGWEETLYTAGGGTLVDDLIRRAGALNVGAEAGDGWPQLSLEALAKADPEIILLGYMGPGMDESKVIEKMRSHPVWARMSAVKGGRVHNISTDLIGRPSPRCLEGLRELVRTFWGTPRKSAR